MRVFFRFTRLEHNIIHRSSSHICCTILILSTRKICAHQFCNFSAYGFFNFEEHCSNMRIYLPQSDLRTKLRRTIKRNLPSCKLKIFFRSKGRLHTLRHFKDSLEKKISSGIIYRYRCSNCSITYYGKTFRHFYTRTAEHMGISNPTWKSLKNFKQSAVPNHHLQCNCTINFDNFDILAAESNKFKLLLREDLLIKSDLS